MCGIPYDEIMLQRTADGLVEAVGAVGANDEAAGPGPAGVVGANDEDAEQLLEEDVIGLIKAV
jgi:hypothetical protein